MVSRFLIYALSEPWSGGKNSGEVRYVGKSSNGLGRPKAPHYAHCGNWIDRLKRRGMKPTVTVLQEFDSSAPLSDAERFWIAEMRRRGCPMTNLTDGGDGLNGHKHSDQTIAKIRAANTTPEAIARSRAVNLGRKFSEDHRAKIGAAKTGVVRSQEWRVNLSLANTGKRHSLETIRRMRHAKLGKRHSLETKLKMSGERNCKSKVSDEQVYAIRANYAAGGVTQEKLAKEYGMTQTGISRIVLFQSRKHLSPKIAETLRPGETSGADAPPPAGPQSLGEACIDAGLSV